jgi:PAS domain S-box-containing protein
MSEQNESDWFAELRRRAEAELEGATPAERAEKTDLSRGELQRLVHELQVHQIELEMQNEELRQTQVEKEQLLDRYQDLYDGAPVGFVTLDENGIILQANRTAGQLLGVAPRRLFGRRFADFAEHGARDDFHIYFWQVMRRGAFKQQVRMQGREGEPFYALLDGKRMPGGAPQNEPPSSETVRIAVSDITARVAAQQALQQAHDELERRVQARTAELTTANQALEAEIAERHRIQEELGEVRRRLAANREAERLGLGEQLHNQTVQDLYGISFQLDLISQQLQAEENCSDLAAVQEMLQHTTRMLRAACDDLRPPTLAPFGLMAAIQSHAERFRIHHPGLALDLDLAGDDQKLSPAVRLALFRIYQEILENVVQHARAGRAEIRFRSDAEQLLLEIQDDGRGFELPERWVELARQDHLGLLAAMERAEAIGGHVDIETAPGEGTLIRVTVPHANMPAGT